MTVRASRSKFFCTSQELKSELSSFLGFGLLFLFLTSTPGLAAGVETESHTKLGQALSEFTNSYADAVVQVVSHRRVGPSLPPSDGMITSPSGRNQVFWSTGIVLDDFGNVIACADGAQPSDSIFVRVSTGETRTAKFLAQDVATGLSLLRVDDPGGLRPAPDLCCSHPVREGDWIVVLPFDGRRTELDPRVGTLDRIRTPRNGQAALLDLRLGDTDGACGGPVVDGNGHFLGMVVDCPVEIHDAVVGSGLSRSISLDRELTALTRGMVLGIADRLLQDSQVRVGFLGVQAELLDSEIADASTSTPNLLPAAVAITHVLADSPAAVAGVQPGDQILEFNGVPVNEVAEVSEWISLTPPGTTIELTLLRNGAPVLARPRVGDRSSLDWMEQRARKNLGLQKRLRYEIDELQDDLNELEAFQARFR